MLTSQLTIHMLKCIVRGHACFPVFLDSSFHSSFHLKSSQRLNEKKQCIANTIKKYNLATAAVNRKGAPVEQGGRHLLDGGPLSVQCSRTLLIFDFKVRRSFEGGALSIERNRMLCFSKERLFISHLNWERRSFGYVRFWWHYIWELYDICGFNRVQCMFCFKACALILQLIIAIQLQIIYGKHTIKKHNKI